MQGSAGNINFSSNFILNRMWSSLRKIGNQLINLMGTMSFRNIWEGKDLLYNLNTIHKVRTYVGDKFNILSAVV